MPDIDFAFDSLPGPALHDALDDLRAAGPVVPARFFGSDAWIITTYDALAAAFRDPATFPPPAMYRASLEPAIGRSFISMDEPDHRVFRRLATPAFRSRAVASYERSGLAALAHELVDGFVEASEVDLVEVFTERFPYLVITRLLGLPREQEGEFHRWAVGLLRFRDDPDNARACAAELTRFLAPIVEARRHEPQNDVISELALAEVDRRRLTDDEIYAHVRLLFPTGGETTHGTLGNLLHATLSVDGLWERLRTDRGLIGPTVDEVLRWETSVAVLPRLSAAEETTFGEVTLPADAWVLFAIAAANHDPAVFPDPHRFDPQRRPGAEPLTFGPGPKSCPGLHLAHKNMSVALEVLTERLARVTLLDHAASMPCGIAPRTPVSLRVRLG